MSWRLIDDYRSSALADQITEFIRTQEASCMDAASFLAIGKKGLKYLTAHTDKETVNALILITDYGRIIPILHKDFNFHYKDVKELEALVVKDANLWLDGGFIFGKTGSGFQRFNVACPRATLEKALSSLKAAVEKA